MRTACSERFVRGKGVAFRDPCRSCQSRASGVFLEPHDRVVPPPIHHPDRVDAFVARAGRLTRSPAAPHWTIGQQETPLRQTRGVPWHSMPPGRTTRACRPPAARPAGGHAMHQDIDDLFRVLFCLGGCHGPDAIKALPEARVKSSRPEKTRAAVCRVFLGEGVSMCRQSAYISPRGVEQLAARRAHNPKVAGSSPAPATTFVQAPPEPSARGFCIWFQPQMHVWPSALWLDWSSGS